MWGKGESTHLKEEEPYDQLAICLFYGFSSLLSSLDFKEMGWQTRQIMMFHPPSNRNLYIKPQKKNALSRMLKNSIDDEQYNESFFYNLPQYKGEGQHTKIYN